MKLENDGTSLSPQTNIALLNFILFSLDCFQMFYIFVGVLFFMQFICI